MIHSIVTEESIRVDSKLHRLKEQRTMTENLPVVKGDYLLAKSDINITELIEESLGGESFSPFDLDRIKVQRRK